MVVGGCGQSCCLLPDLEQLPAAEETGIGEKGINISGGQKARIALARAVYRGAEIYILDDVLAAVDVHVGEHLFKQCICGAMQGATRILVTNALHVLPSCDTVSVIDNGTVAESGSYRELLGKRGGVLAAMVEAHSTKDDDESATADGGQDGGDITEMSSPDPVAKDTPPPSPAESPKPSGKSTSTGDLSAFYFTAVLLYSQSVNRYQEMALRTARR